MKTVHIIILLMVITSLYSGEKDIKTPINIDSLLYEIEYCEIDSQKVKAYLLATDYYSKKGNLSRSISNLIKGRALADSIDHYGLYKKSSISLSFYYENNGIYDKAIKISKNLLERSIERRDTLGMIGGYLKVAGFMQYQQGIDELLDNYLDRAERLLKTYNNRFSQLQFYYQKAMIYRGKGVYNKSVELLKRSLKIAKEINNHHYIGYSTTNVGDSYELLGNYDSCEVYYKQAEEFYTKDKKFSDLVVVLINISSVHKYKGEYKKSEEYLFKALDIAEKKGYSYSIKSVYMYLYGLYSTMNDQRKALQYMMKYDKISSMKSISPDSLSSIVSLEMKHKLERKSLEMDKENNKLDYQRKILAGIMFLLLMAVVITYLYFSKKMKEEKIRQLALTKARMISELKSLQSRINPHFLFNSLSSLLSLVSIDKKGAEEMIISLSNLLRYTLNVSKMELVPLKDEMEIVKKYLNIEKMRLGNRLTYSISCPDGLCDTKIPPLTVQPLVENSLKHGISKSVKGGDVKVDVARDGKNLSIVVKDTNEISNKNPLDSGFGLSNIQKRLSILYKDSGKISVSYNDGVEVKIVVPIEGGKSGI